MANKAVSTRVRGLKELQAELRAVDRALPRELRKVNLAVARDVAGKAQSRAAGVKGGPRLARAIAAVAQQRSGGVAVRDNNSHRPGGTAGALGYEFGSDTYPQFPPWRGSGPSAGYAVYPAIRDERDRMPETYAEALEPLLRRVGKVSG